MHLLVCDTKWFLKMQQHGATIKKIINIIKNPIYFSQYTHCLSNKEVKKLNMAYSGKKSLLIMVIKHTCNTVSKMQIFWMLKNVVDGKNHSALKGLEVWCKVWELRVLQKEH